MSGETTRKERDFGGKAKAAGARLGAKIGKAFSSVGKRFKKADQPEGGHGKPEYVDIAKKRVKPKEVEVSQRDIDPTSNGGQDLPPKRSAKLGLKTNGPSNDSTLPVESDGSEKLEDDCFTCENLITCELRNSSGRPKQHAESSRGCSRRPEK